MNSVIVVIKNIAKLISSLPGEKIKKKNARCR